MTPDPLPDRHPLLQDTYEELLGSDTTPSPYIVTISGQRATGTSKHATDLATEFGIEHVDNGSIQRATAAEHGYDDVDRFRDEHPDADLRTDANKLRRAFDGEPLIAEGRLDGAALAAERSDGLPIAPVRIKLTCEDDERARRYAQREDDLDPAQLSDEDVERYLEEVKDGDESVYDAFADVYDGIDPRDDAFYTHVIDNTQDYDTVHEELIGILEQYGFEQRGYIPPVEDEELGL